MPVHTSWPRLQLRVTPAAALAGLLVCLQIAGCGKGENLPEGFAPAFGTVTLDGQPVQDAQLIFSTPQGDSYARTNADGYYEAERSRSTRGAGLGPAVVKITTTAVFPDMSSEGLELGASGEDYVRQEQIPEHYRQGIEIEITADGAPYDFALKSEE